MREVEIRVLENIDPASAFGQRWESLVQANSAGGFMQSLYWAQVKKLQGLPCLHLGLFQESELIGGTIFYTSQKRNGAGLLIAPEGPVLPWQNELLVGQSLKLIMDKAQSYAGDLGIMAMRIEP